MTIIKALTDLGNGERFFAQHEKDVLYCSSQKKWYYWAGDRWVADDSKTYIYKKARETVRAIYWEAKLFNLDSNDPSEDEILEHAVKSESRSKIRAIVDLAQTFPEVQVSPEEFDSDPMLLNCQNGTINLATGELQEHRREDFISKLTDVKVDPHATCPLWEKFLESVVPDDDSRSYLKKFFGYVLTGLTVEQIFLILYGYGLNGKTTLLETFRMVLGDYARHAAAESFLHNNGSCIRSDIARLKGARFVSSVEISDRKNLDEAAIKSLTGGDPITVRKLYQNEFEYTPQFKLVVASNYKPQIKGVDKGIWRRIVLFPFDVEIKVEDVDKDLKVKLSRELSGILNWALMGCMEWKEHGLEMPEKVKKAVSDYKEESDIVDQFIKDSCNVGINTRVPVKDLYDAYVVWADINCEDKINKKSFGSIIRRKGFLQTKSGSVRYWNQVGLEEIRRDAEETVTKTEVKNNLIYAN